MENQPPKAPASQIIKLAPQGDPKHFFWICAPEGTPFENIKNELLEAHRKVAEKVSMQSGDPHLASKPVAIYAVDLKNFRLIGVNQAMCKIMGYTPKEFLSLNPLRFIDHGEQSKLIERNMNIRNGKSVPEMVEFKLKTKKGRPLRALIKTEIIVENGVAARAVVTSREIEDPRPEGSYCGRPTIVNRFKELFSKLTAS